MDITGLKYLDEKITSYYFCLGNKNILFDFGNNTINLQTLAKLDIIFISHYHYDHISGLIDNIENLSSNCLIYMTNTTFEIIVQIINDLPINNTLKQNKINKLSKLLRIAYFNKENNIENLYFKFYRSGHTFGGYMLYIKDQKDKLFFSSDMDYVKNDFDRQYYIDQKLDVDFAILDGTKIDNSLFKFNKINSIKFNDINNLYLFCKLEKAIFIAKNLSEKYPKTYIIYDYDLEPYINIFYKNGYDCFFDKKNIVTHSFYKYVNDKSPIIILSTIKRNNTQFFPDNLFSLHITSNDRLELIKKYFNKNTKIILTHYNKEISNLNEYCANNNFLYIKEGNNHYEK